MHNCDFRLPILYFFTSNHHPKPLSILHALREDARINVEARAGRVGHVQNGVGQPPAIAKAMIMDGTVLQIGFKNC